MRYSEEDNANYLNTWDVIKKIFFKNKKIEKQPVTTGNFVIPPDSIEINYIAIILDGEVQEVIRAEERLKAILLSDPEFVQIDNIPNRPTIGWKYSDGVFHQPECNNPEHNHG